MYLHFAIYFFKIPKRGIHLGFSLEKPALRIIALVFVQRGGTQSRA